MTTDYARLFARLEQLPAGPEQVAGYEEACRIADSEGNIEAAYDARRELIDAASVAGYPEKEITAFSWCLAQFDRNPDLDDTHSLLWRYKWTITALPGFAQVARGQIESMLDDFSKRIEAYGESERTVHYMRSDVLMQLGDYETALEYEAKYTSMNRTDSSDCIACERDQQVQLLHLLHQDEKAIECAAPILSGQMSCRSVPHTTLATIACSHLRLGHMNEAVTYWKRGYPLVQSSRRFIDDLGELMLVLIRTGDLSRATRQMTRFLPWSLETASDRRRLDFFVSCSLLMEAVAIDNNKLRKLNLPEQLGCWNDKQTYRPSELADWFTKEAQSIAATFDARNGNLSRTKAIEECRKLCGLN